MKTLGTLGILVCILVGQAQGDLNVIGTAELSGSDYNLIWDDDNNGNSVVWLDYTNSAPAVWTSQIAWASGLDGSLSYTLNPGYAVTWDGAWRLPTTVDGPDVGGTDGTTTSGFNITTSELGHLFYEELGNQGYYDTSGAEVVLGNYGLNNTGDFQNLSEASYWSGTEYATNTMYAWQFNFALGNQGINDKGRGNGLAVRSGDVSVVPVPGAAFLGFIGLATSAHVLRRRRKKA